MPPTQPSPKTTKKMKKTKKRAIADNTKDDDDDSLPQKKAKKASVLLLKGMIIGVSTLQGEDNNDNNDNTRSNNPELSYKTVTETCRNLGAQISSQIHKRVHCVLCTESAVQQLTQRVRKAHKKHIPLVNVTWLEQCQEETRRFDFDKFLLPYPDIPSTGSGDDGTNKQKAIKTPTADHGNSGEEATNDPNAGWSSPVELGCCCVCHEQNWEKCDWCGDSCKG